MRRFFLEKLSLERSRISRFIETNTHYRTKSPNETYPESAHMVTPDQYNSHFNIILSPHLLPRCDLPRFRIKVYYMNFVFHQSVNTHPILIELTTLNFDAHQREKVYKLQFLML
jgi:hypothetical protein